MSDLGTREALARLLWAEMAAAGHRQCDIAAAVGITEKHLSQIVNVKVSARPEFVDAILATCGRRLVVSTEPITEPPDQEHRP